MTPQAGSGVRDWRSAGRGNLPAWLVIALAALLAALPLATSGYSCGHDFDFHLRSWMEASAQWQTGIVKPVWAFHAAWDAGEPRLLFYPPLSWWTGGLLTLLLPWTWVYFVFTWLVLFLSGVTMHRLLRRWTSTGIAIFGGCLYLANPYMLFCAYERTAYAELMAQAWMPLLLIALLRNRVTAWRIAVAIGLLWLTNAPAAVVGSYTVLLIGGARLMTLRKDRSEAVFYAKRVAGGFALGLFVDAFYLLPLAVERHYVSLTAALTPAARPEANFLYALTSDEFHNGVILHSSNIALLLIGVAVVCSLTLLLLERRPVRFYASMKMRESSEGFFGEIHPLPLPLLIYSLLVLLLQTPLSTPVWHIAPELPFLQFPWRFLAMQSAVAVLSMALLLHRIVSTRRGKAPLPVFALAGLLVAVITGYAVANRTFRQGCDEEEGLRPQWAAFHNGAGFEQTDEYTPAGADNDTLKIHLPDAWVAASPLNVPPSGDGSLPKAAPLPPEQRPGADDLLFLPRPESAAQYLLVRVRAFHGWHVYRDGAELSTLPQRKDGLYAVPLVTAGPHRVEIRYRTTWDQWAGGAMSVAGFGLIVIMANASGGAVRRRNHRTG